MRQPIFIGMRADKEPTDVVKEEARAVQPPKAAPKAVGNRLFEFTHRDKVFFPKAGYTKGDLIDYYQSVADVIFPYLKDRPHNLLRQPDGLRGQAFFQKDMESRPDWIKTAAIYSESNEKDIHYMVCDSKDALMYMIQLGSIEINPWNSRIQNIDKPDWIVMDLDPEDIGFDKVVEVALAARRVLDKLGIDSYPKTSGKTGIHIYIPLGAKYKYDQARQFGEILANLIHDETPELTSVERSPKKRQKKIYVDFLQNREGQTLAAPYSVRPTEAASVSTPLKWSEINKKLNPYNFTIKNMLDRLDKAGDLWEPVIKSGVDIASVLKKFGDK
jgi:bifunctional non-homologous end joining protein LigD